MHRSHPQDVHLPSMCMLCIIKLVSFIHSLHAFQSVDQVRCSKHSMAALQAALSWDLLHQFSESPANCRSSLLVYAELQLRSW